IYWNNHHHLCQVIEKVNGRILWANIHLLFWLSLIPFVTAWMGENHFAPLPVALYGVVLLFDAIAYFILTLALKAHHDKDSNFVKALGSDFKGKISVVIYAVAIALAFVNSLLAASLYICVALMWLIPDKRFEKIIN
ncbi:MAG: TMEM175 family protein, partial [Ignavibacteriales bacterium]